MFLIEMCAGRTENYNDKNKMACNPMPTEVDINIEVYLFQECHCVLSL